MSPIFVTNIFTTPIWPTLADNILGPNSLINVVKCLSCWVTLKEMIRERNPLHRCVFTFRPLTFAHLMTYSKLQELIWEMSSSYHLECNIHSCLFSKMQFCPWSPSMSCTTERLNYFWVNPTITWGAVSITNWSRFSIFFTSSFHLTDRLPPSIISHPATLSQPLWKVGRIFEKATLEVWKSTLCL